MRVAVAPSGAERCPRFDYPAHLAALAADPPRWPERTGAVSLLALDLDIAREGLAVGSAARADCGWSSSIIPANGCSTCRCSGRISPSGRRRPCAGWRHRKRRRRRATSWPSFEVSPRPRPADETLAATGHRLYRAALARLRDEAGLSFLQPGRFLMPAPGPEPPLTAFFPLSRERCAGRPARGPVRRLSSGGHARPGFALVRPGGPPGGAGRRAVRPARRGGRFCRHGSGALSGVAEALRWRRLLDRRDTAAARLAAARLADALPASGASRSRPPSRITWRSGSAAISRIWCAALTQASRRRRGGRDGKLRDRRRALHGGFRLDPRWPQRLRRARPGARRGSA